MIIQLLRLIGFRIYHYKLNILGYTNILETYLAKLETPLRNIFGCTLVEIESYNLNVKIILNDF
jgi:hypothetical protein